VDLERLKAAVKTAISDTGYRPENGLEGTCFRGQRFLLPGLAGKLTDIVAWWQTSMNRLLVRIIPPGSVVL